MRHLLDKGILLFTIVLCSAFSMAGQRQMAVKDIRHASKRKLIVVVDRLSPEKEKDTISNEFNRSVVYYNRDIKTVVEKFWKFNPQGVEYKTSKEVEELKKNNSKDYVVLRRGEAIGFSYGSTIRVKNMKLYEFQVSLIEDRNYFFHVFLPADYVLTKADLVYGLNLIQNCFNKGMYLNAHHHKHRSLKEWKDKYTDFSKLGEKTLLIRRDRLDSSLKKEDVAKVYPYKFEIISKEEMDRKVMESKPEFAFLSVQWNIFGGSGGGVVLTGHQILNCENGHSMSYLLQSAEKGGDLSDRITLDCLAKRKKRRPRN